MAARGLQFDPLDSKCSSRARRLLLVLGLTLAHYTTLSSHVQAASCKRISSKYQHCGLHPDGVRDLDCFGKYNSLGTKSCVWRPGQQASGRTYTLVVAHQSTKDCRAYRNIAGFSTSIRVFESDNVTVEVLENSESTNCTKAVFSASPKSLLRCGPPKAVTFRRRSGGLHVDVSWQQDDTKAVRSYSVRNKAQGSPLWSQSPVGSENGSRCRVEDLNPSLVYVVQIQCVTSDKCSQCPWSEAYTVPSELTTPPVIVHLEDTDIAEKKGLRLISVTWKFSATEMYDGFFVTVGKASGEGPCERVKTSQPSIRLILSYSAYHLNISAVNNASISPAVSQTIPRREGMPGVGDRRLNVTVHHNTSFTVSWKDDLIKTYVCYSVEWRKKGHSTLHMSFHESAKNYRTLFPLPEPLEPYKRYNITLHTRPNKDTCNMKRVNNSESTYESTQFYFVEGSPVGAPTNISSSNVTLNSAALRWSSIPEEDVRGFLLGYVIHYTEYHHRGADTENNVTVDPTFNSYELKDLRSDTAYQVQISGFTSAGAGVRSTASFFQTNHEGNFNLSGIIAVFAVVAALLIFGSPIIKRAKVVLWPSIPNPGKSNTMQKIDGPCELERLEAISTLKVEEWDTKSLQVVEEEAAIPAGTQPPMVPLLQASEDEADSPEMTSNWVQRDADSATGDTLPDGAANTRRTDLQSSPFAFTSGYTTMEMFQRANTAQATESEPEDTDWTAVKPGLDYARQFSHSPVSDSEQMATL